MIDALVAAFGVGLLGAGHCLGMCGGIVSALSFGVDTHGKLSKLKVIYLYNLGRISSYMVVGSLFGLAGQTIIHQWLASWGMVVLRSAAGLLLIFMGLYLIGWTRVLAFIERLGGHLWKRVRPLGEGLLPVKRGSQALRLGLVWGWLPCGLVYSTLAYAMVQPSWWQSALTMGAFGLGTLPALLLGGFAASSLKRMITHPRFRQLTALAIVAFGVWTLAFAVQHGLHLVNHAGHTHVDGQEFHPSQTYDCQ